MNKGGFSWKRAIGITRAKSRISRSTGIPLTKSGRQRKLGHAVTGGGCLLPTAVMALAGIFLIAACGSNATVPTATPVAATPQPATAAPTTQARATALVLTGNANTGLTLKFSIAAGSYDVQWSSDANDPGGCYLALFVTTKLDGPTVADVVDALLPDGEYHSGTATVAIPKAGSYYVQQDRTGLVNCTGAFTVTFP
jgi:hypothetical protein